MSLDNEHQAPFTAPSATAMADSVQPSCGDVPIAVCQAARISRDPRFDGKFFVGVLSTGIYCRTVCPAIAPKEKNVRYFDSAVKAAQAGLRPCLRCRPDSAPGSNPWKGSGTTLARAIGLIESGALVAKSSGEAALTVSQLADKLGISSRYLNKLFTAGFGTSPKQYALYRQLLFAKQLLHQTDLPITQVALAAGFNSIRRFNEAFKQTLQLTPTQLRKHIAQVPNAAKIAEKGVDEHAHAAMGSVMDGANMAVTTAPLQASSHVLTLYQYYRPPLNWQAMLAFYRVRAVAAMEWLTPESVENGEYGRSFAYGAMRGIVQLAHDTARFRIKVSIILTQGSPVDDLQLLIVDIRRMLDLDADMQQIEQALTTAPQIGFCAPAPFDAQADLKAKAATKLAVEAESQSGIKANAPRQPLIQGLRIPGAGSLFEAVCRAILGQQVSVVQASKLLNQLVAAYGERFTLNDQHYVLFPTPDAISRASLAELKMPGARKLALNALAAFICEHPQATVDDWLSVKGIGPWTIAYAKLRGLGDPNIFLDTDLIVKKRLLALTASRESISTGNVNKSTQGADSAEPKAPMDYAVLSEQVKNAVTPWGSYLTFQLWHINPE